MSNTQDSETERGAVKKAWEGARLLAAGDYERAIAACDEAIRLSPGSIGAMRTRAQARAQAYRRHFGSAPRGEQTCLYCGLKFPGRHGYDVHLQRLHSDTPVGAFRVKENRREDISLPKAIPEFAVQAEAAFAPFRIFLASRGYDPKWIWRNQLRERFDGGTRHTTLGRIWCTKGPIRTIELTSMNETTEESGGEDFGASVALEWRITNKLSYYVDRGWRHRWVPGLQMLSIKRAFDGRWFGNDAGLGIIEHLNDHDLGKPLEGMYEITSEGGDDSEKSDDPHDVSLQRLAMSVSASRKFSRRWPDSPPLAWEAPSDTSWEPLLAVAEGLLADPDYLPARNSAPRNVENVPRPRIRYLAWAPFQLLALMVLGYGLVLLAGGFSLSERFFGGVLASLIGGLLSLIALTGFDEIREGHTQLVGTLDRKWAARGDYVRVEGLPFAVPRRTYNSFSEGDTVVVVFWSTRKKLVRLEHWTGESQPPSSLNT